ncbi:hypothetical protein C8R44DRAFT_754130 [Mycena epipterygia]|nr:hypothetical protein C8R44DRAFT_754130 [Mycena epipterygia]
MCEDGVGWAYRLRDNVKKVDKVCAEVSKPSVHVLDSVGRCCQSPAEPIAGASGARVGGTGRWADDSKRVPEARCGRNDDHPLGMVVVVVVFVVVLCPVQESEPGLRIKYEFWLSSRKETKISKYLRKSGLKRQKVERSTKYVGKERVVDAVLSFNPRQFLTRYHEPDNGLRWLIMHYNLFQANNPAQAVTTQPTKPSKSTLPSVPGGEGLFHSSSSSRSVQIFPTVVVVIAGVHPLNVCRLIIEHSPHDGYFKFPISISADISNRNNLFAATKADKGRTAASTDRRTALALMPVSCLTQSWIDIVLYKTAHLPPAHEQSLK